jgi:hypothetical protein
MILDELKVKSDDSHFTEDHIIFLVNKYRAFILKQKYADIKKQISESDYQTICLDLIEVPAISGEPCEGDNYLRSKEKIPNILPVGNTMVYPIDYYQGNITFISRERMRYVGHNRFLQNIIYCSISPDNYLYFKSSNPQFLYLEKVRMTAIFEDINTNTNIMCETEDNKICDVLDSPYPLEDAYIPVVIELVVKELTPAVAKQEDEVNNTNDDLSQPNTVRQP